jgi:selenocysteine-specific elongation factor
MVADNEELTVISYKMRIDSGRKLAIEVLEYFDVLRFTQRSGDIRMIIDKALPERLFSN